MKGIGNEEKNLKRYLKNHVSLNVESMVKFLITGTIAITLTGCGGGGGGSSSSGGTSTLPPSESVVVEKDMESTKDGDILVSLVNKSGELKKDVALSIQGDGSIAAHIKGSARTEKIFTNNGNINIAGHKSIGILAEGSVKAINNGTIIGKSKIKNQENSYNDSADDNEKEIVTTFNQFDWVTGISGKDGAEIINNSEISIEGHGAGISVENGAVATNNGKINIMSGEQKYNKKYYTNDTLDKTKEGTQKVFVVGMTSTDENSLITNGVNGIIIGEGYAVGMLADKKSQAVNKGQINITPGENKFTETEGKYIEDKVEFSDAIGMMAINSSTATNEGTITIEDRGYGMMSIGENSKVINNGNIVINVKDGQKDVKSSKGMNIQEGSYGENNGSIILTGTGKEINGVKVHKGSTFVNNGKINLHNGIGIMGENGTNIQNAGDINFILSSESKHNKNTIIGIEVIDNWEEVVNNSTLTNTGNITIENNDTMLEWGYENYGINVEGGRKVVNGEVVSLGKIEVVNDGKISIKALNAYGISLAEADLVNTGEIKINGSGAKGISGSSISHEEGVIRDKIENEGDINVVGDAIALDNYQLNAAQGIVADHMHVYNSGNITVEGDGNPNLYSLGAQGIFAFGRKEGESCTITVENNGFIKASGIGAQGIMSDGNVNAKNYKQIDVKGNDVVGMYANLGALITNDENGIITVEGNGIGMSAFGSTATNNGDIELSSLIDNENDGTKPYYTRIVGIEADQDSIATNNGSIKLEGQGIGMEAYGDTSAINNGLIHGISKEIIGVDGEKYSSINGMEAYSNSTITNEVEGIIKITNNGIGMKAISGSTAINKGNIEILGDNSYGMYAISGSTAINQGTITVIGNNSYGMYANGIGSSLDNQGTINIKNADNALKIEDGATIKNNGTINTDGDLAINSSNGGTYIIGTSSDGSYGKITAKNVSIDGDIVVSTAIVGNNFKNEYTMQNIVDSDDIVLGENFNFNSDSLLYDAEAKEDTWGNLDATLSRNDKTISDFTSGYIKETADIFAEFMDEDKIKELSTDAKTVVQNLFDNTGTEQEINNALKDLNPSIYANLGRQIYETSEIFKKQDLNVIESLGDHTFNVSFIGEHLDVDSRDSIEGYESAMTGFVGAMNLGDHTFGTIGYGYQDIDYSNNGDGNIQTIHLGLNKFMSLGKINLKFGIGGEYNFHENKRDIQIFERTADSDFDSYGVRVAAGASRIYGDDMYIKPFVGLDLAHMKYDSFSETGANSINATVESENYTSILPQIGFIFGNKFNGLNLFAGVTYSYELGDMDKAQEFKLEGFEKAAHIQKDELESGLTEIQAGLAYEINNLTFSGAIGKSFGKRDNNFVNISLGYKF